MAAVVKNTEQILASDPACCVWTSASAGTGKTKILTDRIMRLLIGGARASSILCITFTNNAASEMRERINNKLLSWSKMQDAQLAAEYQSISGARAQPQITDIMRSLYSQIIMADEEIGIFTIHSFCMDVIEKNGQYQKVKLLDEFSYSNISHAILNMLWRDEKHAAIMEFFAQNYHESIFTEIIESIIFAASKIKIATDIYCIKRACQSEMRVRKEIGGICTKYGISVADDASLRLIFLTATGKIRKKPQLKNTLLADANPQDIDLLQEKVLELEEAVKIQKFCLHNDNFSKLASAVNDAYVQIKKSMGAIDYNDLIAIGAQILSSQEFSSEISHILLDEAQDTSPAQWQIIFALTSKFADARHSTIFVVGDEKQSIFSFQGAEPDYFYKAKNHIAAILDKSGREIKEIELKICYRCNQEILDAIERVLLGVQQKFHDLFPLRYPRMISARGDEGSNIEIWSLQEPQKKEELFWPLPEKIKQSLLQDQKSKLAERIATFIERRIDDGADASDFMILVRRRDDLFRAVIDRLQDKKIPCSDSDRIIMSQDLSVMNLVQAAKFAINPHDDLNLAALMLSPVMGADDLYLQQVSLRRLGDSGKKIHSIWDILRLQGQEFCSALEQIIEIYKKSHSGNFFIDLLGMKVAGFELEEILLNNNGGSHAGVKKLLDLADQFSKSKGASLFEFIQWFEMREHEIQNSDNENKGVRVMTTHGAKGLQGRSVILCDTIAPAKLLDRFIAIPDGRFIVNSSSSGAPASAAKLKEVAISRVQQEYIRLLYVALSRAERELIICGVAPVSAVPPQTCWYNLLKDI